MTWRLSGRGLEVGGGSPRDGGTAALFRQWVRVLALVALLGSMPRTARAQPSAADRAAAEALFDQAIELIDAGDYATACPKLQESQRLDPGVGTLLYLADCYQQTGRTASAWATFKEAAYAAKNAGQSDREAVANEHAEALKGELSYLIVSVEAPTDDLQIRLDGKVMSNALLASPLPVDPGDHRVEASAPDKEPWEKTVQVPTGAGETTLAVPALADRQPEPPPAPSPAASPPPPATAPPPAPPPTTTPTDSGAAPSRGQGRRAAGYVIGGVGVVGLSMATVFALDAKSKDQRADDECLPSDPLQCSPHGADLSREARDAASRANVAAVLGGVALATGVVLVVTASSGKRRQTKQATLIQVAPLAGPHGGGALLRGEF